MSSVRALELRQVFTQCTNCEKEIEGNALFDTLDNTMYIDCSNCLEEMTVWDWYDDWEKP